MDRYWAENHEHPVLMKSLFAAGYAWWYDAGATAEPGSLKARLGPMLFGLRLPTMLSAGIMVWLLFVVACRWYGRPAALIAVALWTTLPRPFMHAHIACFDYAATASWFAMVYTLQQAARSERWAWASGVVFAVAAAVKFNVYFVPPVMIVWWCCTTLRRTPKADRWAWKTWRNVVITLASIVVIGQLLFIAHWPWLWYDTLFRFGSYLGFHLSHEFYTIQYLGEMYIRPPFPLLFPVVMTFFTVPASTLLIGLVGAGMVGATTWRTWPGPLMSQLVRRLLRREAGDTPGPGAAAPAVDAEAYDRDLLAVTMVGVPFLVIALPNTPIFGGTKHWMHALPYLSILGGAAVQFLIRAGARYWGGLATAGRQRIVALAAACFLAVPGIFGIVRNYPYTLSYYNSLGGGNQGAVRIGMQRQFWGYATLGVLDWVNRNAKPGARVFFHNATHYAFVMYKEEGLLRADIRPAGSVAGSDIALFHVNKIFIDTEYEIWDAYGTNAPVEVLAVDGMPLINVYVRDTTRGPRTWGY